MANGSTLCMNPLDAFPIVKNHVKIVFRVFIKNELLANETGFTKLSIIFLQNLPIHVVTIPRVSQFQQFAVTRNRSTSIDKEYGQSLVKSTVGILKEEKYDPSF